MRRIKITIDYVGTAYSGWQRQPGEDTVQQRLENAVKSLTNETVSVQASGRTDAGVHALGQVAHFDTDSSVGVKNFVTGLNHFLPPDIRVLTAEEVSADFHARFSAHEKTYLYVLYESDVDRAVYLNRAVRVSGKQDLEAMNAAAQAFLGKHDFTSFMSTGADTKTTVRTVKAISAERKNGLVIISVTADGFLYNMVRLIAGALVKAGMGKIDFQGITELIEKKSKTAVTEVMPPYGLYLYNVEYPEISGENKE